MFFKSGDNIYSYKYGVHQGSPISPALFDIYMERVMRELKERMDLPNLWYKLYADDLVIVVPQRIIYNVLIVLGEVSEEYNLTINRKKSGLLLQNTRFIPD